MDESPMTVKSIASSCAPSNKMKRIASQSFLVGGMLVSFRNITYTVRNSHGKRKDTISLLHNVSGYLRPGELVALQGPSGCGKTTLMDLLAGRKTVGTITGEILFGGIAPSKAFLRRYTAYVEQFDTLVPTLTVEEMMRYTAELKFDTSIPSSEKDAAVERILDTLALDTCRKTLIGNSSQRGISGGQAKRVNIGIALITSPSVLFLDEPTTGLDSFTANEVASVLKNLATDGITVCATIHSPTAYSFSLFDRLLLLLRGRVSYFGRNGPGAIKFLESVATKSEIPTTVELSESSPAEWITDITVVADRSNQAHLITDAYEESDLKKHAEEELETQLAHTKDLPPEVAAALAVQSETATSTWHAYKTLLQYRLSKNYNSGEFYGARVPPWIVQSLIMLSVFWGIAKAVDEASVSGIVAIIFFWSICPAFSAASYVPAIVLSKGLYFRERADGLYRPITYLLYLMTEELLVGVPLTALVNMMMWFGLGMSGSFFLWWISFLISFVVGISSAYFIAAISPNIDVANALVPIYGVLCMFFSGFLIRVQSMGWWWRWAAYLTPNYWAVAAQIRNFFTGEKNIIWLGGQTVTEYFAVEYLPAWGFVGVHVVFPTIFLVLAWAALAFVTTVKR